MTTQTPCTQLRLSTHCAGRRLGFFDHLGTDIGTARSFCTPQTELTASMAWPSVQARAGPWIEHVHSLWRHRKADLRTIRESLRPGHLDHDGLTFETAMQ